MKKILMFSMFAAAMILHGGNIPVRRTIHDSDRDTLVIRERVVPRTLMFAEIQSYLLVENYLH